MDFSEQEKKMRLHSVHPGISVEKVIENTGFDLIIPEKIIETIPPTQEELFTLRMRVDRTGFLKNAVRD